ncbi:MAG: pyridoxal-phosphate dependent enzyme [Solirubrobacteraceae bacterium]
MLEVDLPRVALHDGTPTPVRELRDGLWLKDDGAFGAGGWGGNKVRKLEWLLGKAQADGRKRILTFGGRGTNWGLATALYGHAYGIETVLVLVDQPMTPHVVEQFQRIRGSAAKIHLVGGKRRAAALAPWLWARHGLPWILPAGGSTPLGAVGYVAAGLEIGAQVRAGALPEPDQLVVAVGTGGTLAGLIVGLQAAGLRTRAHGVVVNDKLRLDADRIAVLAQRCARLLRNQGADLGVLDLGEDAFTLTRDYLGDGYGHSLPGADPAYDPVYTAKAMAAARELEGTTLFLQTDGPR